ncbi:unnamed protein product [Bursaphelenchus xylophilus]|uniref:(pine wood nematode) hypothetical protein n=1 Tax=Bursaphelenchus xylophilus TaxID=6326 RepID=A0A811KZ72_BURXY|nr:unnamed protein product [Bursaphelenchus xylophilus]CAG9109036.1 unnamed protein product [Bursaphelenchus xylophilus]
MASSEDTLEFLIAKATDPFGADANQKSESISKICAKIDEDFEGPFVAMKLLSYKMLSPNQQEALNSLDSFRHLDKLQQVYNSLKKEKIIESDPVLEASQIPKLTTREQRVCAMGDEEKEKLLSQLLRSRNPEDLQAANRMIKSMVRTEENKFESERKRNELIETARVKSGLLNDLMDASSLDRRCADISLLYDLFESLINLRPKLFHLAAEAAERSDERMAEILALNDDLNQTIQRYKGGFEDFVNAERTRTQGEKDNGKREHRVSEPCLIDGFGESYNQIEEVTRQVDVLNFSGNNDKQSETHHDIDSDFLTFACPSTSYNNEIKSTSQNDDLESILMNDGTKCNGNARQPQRPVENDNFLLKDVQITLDEVDFLPAEPIVFCDRPIVKGLLYFINPKEVLDPSIICTLATLAFTSTQEINNVAFSLSVKSPIFTYRNVDSQVHKISAFNPLKPTPTLNQVFLLLPLAGGHDNIQVEYELSSDSFNYTGTFKLPLPK